MSASSPPVSLPDRYRAVRRIAAGGMATVFAAEDTLLGRLVAIKVLGAHFAADAAAIERFSREARAAARVSDHPHVVTIYDVGEVDDGAPFIVMEHFAGGTLADRLRAGTPIARVQALRWIDEAASALDHAHRHGIVHRDVKPGNLLLDEHGRLAVGDFGIARMASDGGGLTQTGTVLGTAAYLSPEQALGEEATAASDRYALAVVAFELLAGRRPFDGGHAAAQARAHVESPPPAASALDGTLPAAVDRALWRGLEKEPDRRWRSCRDLVEALESAVATDGDRTAATRVVPARTPPHTPAPRGAAVAGDPGRRRLGRGALAALAAVLLLAGLAVAAFALTGGDGGERTAGGGPSTARTAASGSAADRDAKKKDAGERARDRDKEAEGAATKAPPAETPTPTTETPATQERPATEDDRPSGSSTELQAQGHRLIDRGDYGGAIAALQQAIQDCPVSTTDPCAYAYYDLGHALRLAGRPAEAVDVLRVRLQNPNQRDVVAAELAAAQQAAGQTGGAEAGSAGGAGAGAPPGDGQAEHERD